MPYELKINGNFNFRQMNSITMFTVEVDTIPLVVRTRHGEMCRIVEPISAKLKASFKRARPKSK